jgi:hypothetical protein
MTYSSGNCPQCGVKFNSQESDTVRQCEACGFVVRKKPFSLTGCVSNLLSLIAVSAFILICCGGFVLFILYQNAESPPPPTPPEVTSDSTPAPEPTAVEPAATVVATPESTPEIEQKLSSTTESAQEPAQPLTPSPEIRTWTDKTGSFSTEARFGGMIGTTVVLHKADGTTAKVQFDQLSDSDREWINAKRRREGLRPVNP